MVDLVTTRSPIPEGRSRSAGRLLATLIAFTLSFAALVAAPQAAHAADVVAVPDASLKAVLNAAIASATGTTRTPTQDITTDDAPKVTAIDGGAGAPIADFTGVASFPNLTNVSVYNTASTISLDPFAGSAVQILFLVPVDLGVVDATLSSDLSALGSMSSLNELTLAGYALPEAKLQTLPEIPTLQVFRTFGNGMTDISPVRKLTHLVSLDLSGNKIRDLSPVAEIAGLQTLTASQNLVSDLSFLPMMKKLQNLLLQDNRIEDVTPLAALVDRNEYDLNGFNQTIDVSLNRIADLSPLDPFSNLNGPTVQTFDQSLYLGSYQTGGVPIKIRSWRIGPPAVTPTDTGSYNGTTDLLVSNDPAAAFLRLVSGGLVDSSWTVNFSEAPDKLADLRVNEVESNGDAINGDWVEVYNPAATAVDLSGLIVADSDDSHKLVVPVGTMISAKGYKAIVTEDASGAGPFGLGGADSVRLFAPGTTDLATTSPLDSYTWTTHATSTYGRTVPGTGIWSTTDGGTFGAVNEFPAPTVIPTVAVTGDGTSTTGAVTLTATVTKPDSTDMATDATGTVVFAVDGADKSGPVTVANGVASWTANNLAGSPAGVTHQITARYVSAGDEDPYDDSAVSAAFTVTVTIGEFTGAIELSTTTPAMCGAPIVADVSSISPTPDSVSYQWQQESLFDADIPFVNISGATTASYLPGYLVPPGLQVPAQPNAKIRLTVVASKAGYASKTFTSVETARPTDPDFLTKPAAVLSTTTPKVGQTITATHEDWTTCIPAEFNYKSGYNYQWLRDGQPIEGATDSITQGVGGAGGPKEVSYTVTPADAGHRVSLRVRSSTTLAPTTTVVSAETSAVAVGSFTQSPVPVIDKMAPKLGDTVTASAPVWSPVAELSYQWLRDGAPIVGATSASYTAVAADTEHVLSVRATGTAAGYEPTVVTSAVTTGVGKGTFAQAGTPVLGDSTPVVGDTVTATAGAWSPAADLGWQWLRDGQPIAGATAASYVVSGADVDGVLSVRVSGTAAGYQGETRTSAATAKVAALQVSRSAAVKYAVTVTAVKGKKVRVGVSTKGVPVSRLAKSAVVKVAGIKGSYTVRLVNGKATLALGKKAKGLKSGKKVKVSVSLTKAATSTTTSVAGVVTTTTYTVAKTTKAVKVKLK